MNKVVYALSALFIVSNYSFGQSQFQVGVAYGNDGFVKNGILSKSLDNEVFIEVEGGYGSSIAWQFSFLRPLSEKINWRVGLEAMKSSTTIRALEPSNYTLIGNNINPYYRLGVPIDIQYRPVGLIKFTLGLSTNLYSPHDNFIAFDESAANQYWTNDQRVEVQKSIDIIRGYSFEYRFGIEIMPTQHFTIECLLSTTINKMNDQLSYFGEDQKLDVRYRILQIRLNYSFISPRFLSNKPKGL